jgi:hypothetical protein
MKVSNRVTTLFKGTLINSLYIQSINQSHLQKDYISAIQEQFVSISVNVKGVDSLPRAIANFLNESPLQNDKNERKNMKNQIEGEVLSFEYCETLL